MCITTDEDFSNIVISKDYGAMKAELDEYMASDEMYTSFEKVMERHFGFYHELKKYGILVYQTTS